ncbi:transposase [Pistricoccus aurantiacus]|uniref:Transposase n=1 Tax=Pistricoccus aurantiacus TaxID=1883414 RepID=A0A5B8T1H6_9GAMM|nr:transposase [Pistricoccus aurantiacus]
MVHYCCHHRSRAADGSNRHALTGILFVLRLGIFWEILPQEPPAQQALPLANWCSRLLKITEETKSESGL